MKFIIERSSILKPLKYINSILSGNPTLHILNNLLLHVKENHLLLIGSNLEVELSIRVALHFPHDLGSITVSARKFFEICRNLPENSEIKIFLENDQMFICSQRSYFRLSTLSSDNFPKINHWKSHIRLVCKKETIKNLIESTQFSMAYQDVRYYLNGILFETKKQTLRTVATDGHRLAMCTIEINDSLLSNSIIIPRKGVIELMRILENESNIVTIEIGKKNIRLYIGDYVLTSKLIDGEFPNYHHVLPKTFTKVVNIDCNLFKKALVRVSILSNAKFRIVRLLFTLNQLKISTKNMEQEEAEEILDVSYQEKEIEIFLNINYILDVLNVLNCKNIKLFLNNETSSVQIEDCLNKLSIYVIMPIRQ